MEPRYTTENSHLVFEQLRQNRTFTLRIPNETEQTIMLKGIKEIVVAIIKISKGFDQLDIMKKQQGGSGSALLVNKGNVSES